MFTKQQYKVADLPLKEIKTAIAGDFEHFLVTHEKGCNNTAMKYIRILKRVLKFAVDQGCDSCNWYFGTKIEKELLEQPFFKHVRLRQSVRTKHGKLVPWEAYSLFPVQNPEKYINSGMSKEELFNEMLSQGGLFYSPFIFKPVPDNPIVSRFLAKVAIEGMANICIRNSLSLSEVIDNDGLNALREYARYGNGKFWPCHQRLIYDENKLWSDAQAEDFQFLHEYNIISFKQHEYYLVLAIFGFEFAINFGNRNLNSFL